MQSKKTEKPEIEYRLEGDRWIPYEVPKSAHKKKYGRWGIARKGYLIDANEGRYNLMVLNDVLVPHLNEIDKEANELWDRLMEKLQKQRTAPPQGTMEWVQHMNRLRAIVDEIIYNDIIRV